MYRGRAAWLDNGAVRRYRRERLRAGLLLIPPTDAMVSALGKVEVTDAIASFCRRLTAKVIYTAAPVAGWRFAFDRPNRLKISPASVAAGVPGQARVGRRVVRPVLGLEPASISRWAGCSRALSVKISAFEAKHSHNNVVHLKQTIRCRE